jgi:hypothetical protein
MSINVPFPTKGHGSSTISTYLAPVMFVLVFIPIFSCSPHMCTLLYLCDIGFFYVLKYLFTCFACPFSTFEMML